MQWPQHTEYNEAIQNPRGSFADPELQQGEPALNAMGLPIPISGSFATVYKVHCPQANQTWAVKCFTREVPGLRERYQAISEHLSAAKLPFMVDFHYLDSGIRIRGEWFPVLKMRWVEGFTLTDFVNNQVDKPQVLEHLGRMWVKLARGLRKSGTAHADLQHGNVLLVPGAQTGNLALRLIDYDGMFVPALAGRPSGEAGHPNYQHPIRLRDGSYSAEVDRFSHLVIYTALTCVARHGASLWNRYYNAENLLFREQDFKEPSTSELFHELWAHRSADIRLLTGTLILACQGALESVPLLEDLVGSGDVAALTSEQEKQVEGVLGSGKAKLRAVPRGVRESAPAENGVNWGPAELHGSSPMPQRADTRGSPIPSWVLASAPSLGSSSPTPSVRRDVAPPANSTDAPKNQAGTPTCTGCGRSRTFFDVTCPECGFTRWDVIVVVGIAAFVFFLLKGLFGSWWDVGGIGLLFFLLGILMAVQGLRAAKNARRPEAETTRWIAAALGGANVVLLLVVFLGWSRRDVTPALAEIIPGEKMPPAPTTTPIPFKKKTPLKVEYPPTETGKGLSVAKSPPETRKLPAEPKPKNEPPAKVITNSINMKLVWIESGRFQMGSAVTEEDRDNDEFQHEVEITQGFYIGAYEVTQDEYRQVMGKSPSHFNSKKVGMSTDDFPVENVSWNDAMEFCRQLTAKEKARGRVYDLPTEAEWEYACRAGTTSVFAFGNALDSNRANFNGNYPYGGAARVPYFERTTNVGAYKANCWGLYDMHGNVWEWCKDWIGKDYYRESVEKDPPGPAKGTGRVLRGGSWYSHASYCRSALHDSSSPDNSNNIVGFRVVVRLSPPSKKPEKAKDEPPADFSFEKKPDSELQGKWKLVRVYDHFGDRKSYVAVGPATSLTVNDAKLTFETSEREKKMVVNYTLELDQSKDPKVFRQTLADKSDGHAVMGIYSVKKEILHMAFQADGRPPESFSITKDDEKKRFLLEFERVGP